MRIEEDIILMHAHERGMDRLRKYLPADFCRKAAEAIANVLAQEGSPVALLTTGFYVNGAAETDGPPGAYFLYRALKTIGFRPILLTDAYGAPLFKGWIPEADLVEVPTQISDEEAFRREIFETYSPSLLCAVERCGRTRDGAYRNMNGEDISPFTSPIDALFMNHPNGCLTVGIGDGGNEIGMGNLRDFVASELVVDPSIVPVDHLIVATVSNWGAYGLIRYLEILTGCHCLPGPHEVKRWITECVRRGAVDGISGRRALKVDGFSLAQETSIVEMLKAWDSPESFDCGRAQGTKREGEKFEQ